MAAFAMLGAMAASTVSRAANPGDSVVFDLETAKLDDLQQAMDAKVLTSVQLVNIYMQRIAAYDQAGVKLNAVPALNPNALEDAAAADARRAAGEHNPLLGVPFVIKGSIAAKDMALTDGLTAWVDLISPFDAFLVQKLRAAGAVFLGHANLDAFQNGTGGSTSQNWGTVRNAYALYTNSGGSSGGSAVATGADLAFFAIGCETGGSIRIPSDRAGVVGIKSSNSMVSVRGAVPLGEDRDEPGPMTRYAVDNAKVLDVVTQHDDQDVWNLVELSPGRARASDYAAKLKALVASNAATPLAGKTIGVLTNYLATAGAISANTNAAGDIDALFQQAKADLTALGATVVDLTLPIKSGDATTYLDITYTGRRDSVPAEIVTPPQRKLYTPVTSDTTGNMSADARAWGFEHLIESLVTSPTDPDRLTKIMSWINPVTQITAAMKTSIQNGTTFDFSNPIAQEHFQAVRYQIADYEAWLATAGPGGTPVDAVIFPVATSKSAGTTAPTDAAPTPIGGSTSNPGRALINSFSLPFVAVPMGTIIYPAANSIPERFEPSDLGFLGNKYFGDADLMAIVGAYESGSHRRAVSPLAPALAEEHIEYVVPQPAPVTVPDSIPPVASVKAGTTLKGSGKNEKLVFTGSASDGGGVASVVVTVNGKRIPVKLTAKGWEANAKLPFLKKLAKKGVKKVKVIVVVTDASGNAIASTKMVKIPSDLLS